MESSIVLPIAESRVSEMVSLLLCNFMEVFSKCSTVLQYIV